jgi:hypothetical protein
MALLQISEPGQSSAPHQHKLAIGIDLGTTNSLVASVKSGESVILKDENNNAILPSVVHCGDNNKLTVGCDACPYAKTDPTNTIISVKRYMGLSFKETSQFKNCPYQLVENANNVLFRTKMGDLSAVEISSSILNSLKERAEKTLGGDLIGAVITVPAYFNDAQRQATKDAATLAGLKTLRLLNEPTAAAVAYGLESGEEGIHAIYDLGGGTFDISILSFSKGVFKVANRSELEAKLTDLFEHSALVLAQEYMYTEYDWRVGVLNGRAIYACRYLMARNHWQIYNHDAKRFFSGGFETLPTFELPKAVLDAALKACKTVAKGLYGVDVKEHQGKAYVLEVNDNPSIDHKVEDGYLGDELYMIIMDEFKQRLEARGRG